MFLISAILIICLAHIIRVFRWELLIETYEKPDGTRLVKSLSLGYLINYFIPFKIGDLGRAAYAGSGMRNGRGFALATVIVERCIDILTVGAMFFVMGLWGFNGEVGVGLKSGILNNTLGYYIVLAAVVAGVLLLILLLKKYIKKLIYVLGGLLNEKYEEKTLRFFWALIWGFKDILNRLPKIKLIVYTVIMWGLYLSSYWSFATYLETSGINKSFYDVFLSLFDQKSLLSSGIANGFGFDKETLYYAIYMILPLLLLLVISYAWNRAFGNNLKDVKVDNRANDYVKSNVSVNATAGADVNTERLNLLPQANVDERRAFLKMYFAGEKKEYIDNYLKITRNIFVLRDYSAGSNATTILCTDGNDSFYRKYAFQSAAGKLNDQIEWMKSHEDKLPLAEILRSDVNEVACYYDMPYSVDAMTMFDFAQAGNKEKAWEVLERVIKTLEEKLYGGSKSDEDSNDLEALSEYIDKKIVSNLEKVLESKVLRELLKYKTVVINGVEYDNLSLYTDLLSKDNLKKIFENDAVSDIHGDLTIENIVCTKNDGEFYLIDPNTGNIFNSKFIDYAKLLQSLHGNYEFLMAVTDVSVEGNHIDFRFVKSDAYSYLYDKYKEYLEKNFSKDEIKSIYYHEVANWLRLMPYKLEKGRGELFYAGLLMVLADVKKLEER